MRHNKNKAFRTIGVTMLIIGWLLILSLLWILYSRVIFAPQQPEIKYINGTTKIILYPRADGHYWIDGIIHDTKIEFLIDTGASITAIPEQLAEKLALPKLGKTTTITANGKISTYITKIDKLIIGGIILSDIRAVILPSFGNAQALLGMNVLKKFQIEQNSKNLILLLDNQD